MIEDEKITKAIASLAKQVNTIELNMKEQDRKEYERKNKKCWYCTNKGVIKNGICSNCLMRN